jgi:hypothetical protein
VDSIVRFFLGLPARMQDVEEVQRIIPEFHDLDRYEVKKRIRRIHRLLFYFDEDLFEEFKSWTQSSEHEIPKSSKPVNCPKEDCPMKGGQLQSDSGDDFGYLQFLSAGGGPDSKPLKGMFFDLVRKSRKNMGSIKEVILTDPYIYHDLSEDGVNGGYDSLAEYFKILGLCKESFFTLKKNPSPKRATKKNIELLNRFLKNNYPNISIDNYSPKCNFHDRFYIVRDDKGQLGGVFGPSLNGLNSTAIVLMGNIEGIQPLKKLSQWL